jgi:hypothetical protein
VVAQDDVLFDDGFDVVKQAGIDSRKNRGSDELRDFSSSS